MLTEYEALMLQRQFKRELNAGPRTVWRCAAGLLVLFAILVAGGAIVAGY